ncbi:MAG: TolC family protein [Gammaproteobacteria bacterium]|nr:TolC family protein [Gammaproteobacteria bacterium]
MPHYIGASLILGMVTTLSFAAQQSAPQTLPSPLTLDYALSLADELTPDLQAQQAELAQAQAQQLQVDAATDVEAYLEARARYVDPPRISADQSHNDNRYGLVINKDIYDFGKHSAQVSTVYYELESRRLNFLDARSRRRLLIAQRYYDVLLADLQFNRDDERMSSDYVRFDRLRKRKAVGQSSDVVVFEAEARYQKSRVARYQSQTEQRRTRASLAEALNRPKSLPETLDPPTTQALTRVLPEYEVAVDLALKSNYYILALRSKVSAAEQAVAAARAQDNPVLRGSAEAFKYSRELSSNDEHRIGVTLTVPLYTGSRTDAAIALAQAHLQRSRAQVQQAESDLRQTILQLWLELGNLRAQREEMAVLTKFRELNLDRSRALYEMEVNADLGDAMVLITDAQYQSAQTDYKMLLDWLRLDILTGQYPLSNTVTTHDKP